jgi:uncharacterized protein with FMN-binding domain
MSRRSKVALIVVAFIAILAAAIAGVITISERNQKKVFAAVMEDFDLAQVPDGTYTGNYNAFPVVVKVEVTVLDRVITSIGLIKHQNGRGEAAEVIPEMVVHAQSLLVDTISGATFSSKVILLTIQDALQSAFGK